MQFPEDLANSSVLGKMFLFSGKAWSEYGYVKKTTLHVKVSRGRLEKEGLGSSHQVKNISRAGPDNG